MKDVRPVLFYDSGLGGLTVLREARYLLPCERLLYVADDAAFPIGRWPEEDLLVRLQDQFTRLIEDHDPKAVVIACNTAFTLGGVALREAFPGVPFVGTVPAIKPAAERTASGLISVLATPGTVRRAYTRSLIESFAAQCHVRLVGSDNLAELAEQHLRGEPVSDEALLPEISDCFLEQNGQRTDIVVLACTHYPFLANRFRKIAPWPVDWLDPAEAIARQLVRVLGQDLASVPSESPDLAILTSGARKPAIERLLAGFGLALMPGRELMPKSI
ncbi:glutamate racemase [Roseibium alexandrii]|uniref:Glutamate racemase n=1 Tax=Roseibium alexandrii (strain DSM 17067 / NCIMB 14079 / DFL-11) TaxID=244592 RepID=A0A5E8GXZ3_ROSAD|nr:glutamate racemase [Roseibium alexandrii]EEE44964.2 glutamate racemase [Roseibium alexandrii DFL-11]